MHGRFQSLAMILGLLCCAIASCTSGATALLGEPVAAAGKYTGTMNCLETDALGVQAIQPSRNVQLEFDDAGVPTDLTITAINRTARQVGLDLELVNAYVDTTLPSAQGDVPVRITLVEADYSKDPIRVEIEVLFLDAAQPAGESSQPAFGTAMHLYEINKLNTSLDVAVTVIDNQNLNETQYTQCSAILKPAD